MASESSRRELPNTYFVQDRSNEDEFARLRVLDRMLTTGMGGVLPEQPDPTRFKRVLDVGCGAGGWLIETAVSQVNCTWITAISYKLFFFVLPNGPLHSKAECAASPDSVPQSFQV